jgi:small subunit ribosomal protein S6
MAEYETLIVLHPDLGEAATKEMVARVRSILEGQQAVVGNVDEWGLRELAYPIRKQHRGFYFLVEHEATHAAVSELERLLRLSDGVLRFLTVRKVRTKPLPPPRARTEPGEEGAEESA